MDDLEFWGTAGEGGPVSMQDEWEGAEELAGELMEMEHLTQDVPAVTALLHRAFPTYREVMWIRGYPNAKTIVITVPAIQLAADTTMPGVIRNVPVGWRDLASAETFRARFEAVVASYVAQEWQVKAAITGTGDGQ